MTYKNEETVVDAQMHHPFRCLVAGPSQSGKSTFVCSLLLWQNDIIDICFGYVTIIFGTEANKNEILSSLKGELRPGVVEIIELKKLYETAELMKKNFSSEFEHFVKNKANRKKKGCVIFDDLCQSVLYLSNIKSYRLQCTMDRSQCGKHQSQCYADAYVNSFIT